MYLLLMVIFDIYRVRFEVVGVYIVELLLWNLELYAVWVASLSTTSIKHFLLWHHRYGVQCDMEGDSSVI